MKKIVLFILAIVLLMTPAMLEAQADSSLITLLETSEFVRNEIVSDSLIFEVSQNYPNPCREKSNIDVTINSLQIVTFKVINLLGGVLIEDSYGLDKGIHKIELDLSKLNGGIYFYTVTLEGKADLSITRKFIIE